MTTRKLSNAAGNQTTAMTISDEQLVAQLMNDPFAQAAAQGQEVKIGSGQKFPKVSVREAGRITLNSLAAPKMEVAKPKPVVRGHLPW